MALCLMGIITHTVQDFCNHSTWVGIPNEYAGGETNTGESPLSGEEHDVVRALADPTTEVWVKRIEALLGEEGVRILSGPAAADSTGSLKT